MLRQFYAITTNLLSEDCLPINTILLPGHQRNLFIPCQFGSMASHEVAQSRIPSNYGAVFEAPDTKLHTEWSLIGGKGAISPFHVDPEGLGTAVVALEGRKYWIVATRFGENDHICSVDSLEPTWDPYFINVGDNVNCFCFEAVHFRKGNML